MTAILTAARLRELLHYDALTGVFTWIKPTAHWVKAGDIAGCPNSGGYILIGVDREYYGAQRLAWLYMTGEWPKDEVDHEDGIKSRNVWTNLRDGSHQFNMQNMRKAKAGKVLPLGVTAHHAKFRASIRTDTKLTYLGLFATPDAAHNAYLASKRALHPGCTL